MKLTGEMVRDHQVKKSARMLNILIFLFYNIFKVCANNTIRDFNVNVLGLSAFNRDSVSYQIISSWGKTSKLICVSTCFQNPECDAAVVCKANTILQCSHVKGNVFNQVDVVNSASGECQLITRERCSNGGVFYNDMCHCPVGFTGPGCNLIFPVCCQNVSRQNEYSAMTDGHIYSGSVPNVIDAIKLRETHKILVKGHDYDSIYSVMSRGFFYYYNVPRVWAQTCDHISVDFTDRSNKTITRVIKQISNRRISSVTSELNSSDETRITTYTDIEWASGTAAENVPILEIDGDGNVTSGSVSDCRDALENGSDLRITISEFSLKSELIYFENSLINVHMLSPVIRSSLTIVVPSVWFSLITESDGNSKILRWNRISHNMSKSTNINLGTSWYIDSGWHVAYSHDSSGSRISGSKFYLESSVRNGKPIKVKMNDMISRLHDVRVSIGEVTGVMVDMFNLTLWAVEHAHIIRSRVSTTGTVSSCTFTWESDLDLGWSSRREGIVWYVGSRPWTKIVTLNPFDGISWGVVDDLYLAATSWKSLKVVMKHLDSSYQSVDINNIHLMNSTLIILDTTIQGAVQSVGDELICQQWAGFLYTDGMYETVKWTTGRTILEERTVIQYTSVDIFSEI